MVVCFAAACSCQGFVVPECFECRPECTSWCTSLTLPILFGIVRGTVHNLPSPWLASVDQSVSYLIVFSALADIHVYQPTVCGCRFLASVTIMSDNLPPLYFDGTQLPYTDTFKYLGMVCDRTINLDVAADAVLRPFTAGTF
eukprot:1158925-Pelagomonas_calceolata.AAC.5